MSLEDIKKDNKYNSDITLNNKKSINVLQM